MPARARSSTHGYVDSFFAISSACNFALQAKALIELHPVKA